MKKLLLFFLFLLGLGKCITAQVPQKIVVEHFTNTRCSICAGTNPGFYNNLKNQNDVIHIAVHPSSPYPACVLSQQNVSENDARTNYYGVYGGTPKFVINGEVLSSSSASSPTIFNPYQGKFSPFLIRIVQIKFANDSVRSTISIKTVDSHSYTTLQLFVALTEDTLFYNSPNGEDKHYDVFRKSLSGATGQSVSIASAVGDSIVFSKSDPASTAWNFSRINTIAILQTVDTKSVLQSETTTFKPFLITGIDKQNSNDFSVKVYTEKSFSKTLHVNHSFQNKSLSFSLFDISGRLILKKEVASGSETINTEEFSSGLYIFTISFENSVFKNGKIVLD